MKKQDSRTRVHYPRVRRYIGPVPDYVVFAFVVLAVLLVAFGNIMELVQ